MMSVKRVGVLLAAVIAASGCGSDDLRDGEESMPTTVAATSERDHVLDLLPVEAIDDGSDAALFVGVLNVRAGCAVLEMDEGTAVIHWPFGSGLVPPSSVSRPGQELVDIAERQAVEMGGGVGDAERGLRLDDATLTECIDRTGATAVLFSSGTVNHVAARSDVLSCESDFGEIIGLLRSGLPPTDYDPAPDLEALVQRSDAITTGTIDSLVRSAEEPDSSVGRPTDSWTIISTAAHRVLHAFPDPVPELPHISMNSFWASGLGDDPLERSVAIKDFSFVAFLVQFDAAPGGYAVEVQGLAVGCTGSDAAAVAVIQPLPSDAVGLSVDELAVRARTTSQKLF